MTIVIYRYPDGSSEEIFGPFKATSELSAISVADRWIDLRQNNWPSEKRWTGKFVITEMRHPFPAEGEDDHRINMWGRLDYLTQEKFDGARMIWDGGR